MNNKEFTEEFQNNIFLRTANHIVEMESISKCEKFGICFSKLELKELKENEVNLSKFTLADIFSFMVILRNKHMAKEFQGKKK